MFVLNPCSLITNPHYAIERVGDKYHGYAGICTELVKFGFTLALECLVSYSENFIKQEDIGLKDGNHSKAQFGEHTRRICTHRLINELIQLGKFDDSILIFQHLCFGEPKQYPVEHDILTPSHLGVETRSKL